MAEHFGPAEAGRPPTDRPRRRYDASRRQAAAAERRDRIVDVAGRLFSELGWTTTTIARIAAEAEVSSELVSTSFGSKAALLLAAFRRRAFGGEAVRLPEALRSLRLDEIDDIEQRRARVIDYAREAITPIAPLLPVIEVAADQDQALAERWRDAQVSHYTGCQYLAEVLADGPTRPEAAEELFLIFRGETYVVFTRNRDWTDEQWMAWLHRSVAAALTSP